MLGWIRGVDITGSGGPVLEIGPGYHFSVALAIASHGATVSVADRFLTKWDNDYHPAFYRAFRQKWDGPTSAFDAVIAAGRHEAALTCVEQPGEGMSSFKDGIFRLVISNAVLEHVISINDTAAELARVTLPGGINFHQVDFRDHNHFDRPLEHLLLSPDEWRADAAMQKNQRGTQLRAETYANIFSASGFGVETFVDMRADHEYLADLFNRIPASSGFANVSPLAVGVLSALFKLTRN